MNIIIHFFILFLSITRVPRLNRALKRYIVMCYENRTIPIPTILLAHELAHVIVMMLYGKRKYYFARGSNSIRVKKILRLLLEREIFFSSSLYPCGVKKQPWNFCSGDRLIGSDEAYLISPCLRHRAARQCSTREFFELFSSQDTASCNGTHQNIQVTMAFQISAGVNMMVEFTCLRRCVGRTRRRLAVGPWLGADTEFARLVSMFSL